MPKTETRNLPTFPKLVFRKLVYRSVEMRRYGVSAGASTRPGQELSLELDLLGPERFGQVLGSTPYLDEHDVQRFRDQQSSCIVVRDGDRIAASTWMTKGSVFIHELQRTVLVPTEEHFSCRSYVAAEYRGFALLSHMIHFYSALQPPTDHVWGLVYGWNTPSIGSLERLGWRYEGDYRTKFVVGRKFGSQRRFDLRLPDTRP